MTEPTKENPGCLQCFEGLGHTEHDRRDGGPWVGLGHDEWIARIMSFSLNDGGVPPVRNWQTERLAPNWDDPFIGGKR